MGTDGVFGQPCPSRLAACTVKMSSQHRAGDLTSRTLNKAWPMLRDLQPEGPCRSPVLPGLLHQVLTQGAGQQPTL